MMLTSIHTILYESCRVFLLEHMDLRTQNGAAEAAPLIVRADKKHSRKQQAPGPARGAHLRREAHVPAVQQRHGALLQQAQQVADALPLVRAQPAAPVQAPRQVVAWRGDVARAAFQYGACARGMLAVASRGLAARCVVRPSQCLS
jgi:hypothetical protein